MNAALNRLVGLRRDYLVLAALAAGELLLSIPVWATLFGGGFTMVWARPSGGSATWADALGGTLQLALLVMSFALAVTPVALAAVFAVRPPDYPMQNPPRPDIDARIVRVLTVLLVLLVLGAVEATGLRIWTVWRDLSAPAVDGEVRLAASILGPRYFWDALRGVVIAWLLPVLLWLLRRDYASRAAVSAP